MSKTETQAIDNKIKCKECNGKGYITPTKIHSIKCSTCNGTGYIQNMKNIDEQICYKNGKPCKYNCSGLCKDSY